MSYVKERPCVSFRLSERELVSNPKLWDSKVNCRSIGFNDGKEKGCLKQPMGSTGYIESALFSCALIESALTYYTRKLVRKDQERVRISIISSLRAMTLMLTSLERASILICLHND